MIHAGNGVEKFLRFSAICVWILSSRKASSSLTSPSPGCSSDLDCSLNGRCVEKHQVHFPFEPSNEIGINKNKAATTTACVCDKPWTGNNCEQLQILPTRGKHQAKDNLLPTTAAKAIAPQGYGMTPNITTWGGGILVEPINSTTNVYHLYVSRMSNDCLLEHWYTNSRIDHAVSNTITGPYKFSNVAIPTFSHNPAPIELWKPTNQQWKYAIFHLGDGTNGTDGGYDCRKTKHSNQAMFRDDDSSQLKGRLLRDRANSESLNSGKGHIHVSNSLNGPWVPLVDHNLGHCNNPAPWVHPVNGTLFVLCSHGKSTLFKSEHGYISGPYEFVTEFQPKDNHSIHTAHEDPFLYTDANGNFHIIYHAYQYTGSPEECHDTVVSAHVYSRDGYEWHASSTPPYGSQIEVSFSEMTISERKAVIQSETTTRVTLATRERPKLIVKEGLITHMVQGVCAVPGCKTTGAAPFCVDCKYLNWDFTLVSVLLDSS